MNSVTRRGLALLGSAAFFAQLRGALARAGLRGEEKFGVGVYFVMISSVCPKPLRVAILETTEGGAEYVVRCVSRLFEPGTICGVDTQCRWTRLKRNPTQRVAYVRQWSDGGLPEDIHFETKGNQLTRITGQKCNGRFVPTAEVIEGRFACIAQQYPWESADRSGWLTIRLPVPTHSAPNGIIPLGDDEIAMWVEVQRLLQERAEVPVVFPDWADAFVEQTCDRRGAVYLPVFLRAWQTMTILRSFVGDGIADQLRVRGNVLQAGFDDLAVTSLLLRSVFQQGSWFPPVAKIFNAAFHAGDERGVINPITGKGVRYTWRPDRTTQSQYAQLGVM